MATRTPPTKVNIHHAKTHLSRLLERVVLGEEFIIARAGEPVARLCGLDQPANSKTLGLLQDWIDGPIDIDAPLPPDLQRLFERR